MGFFKRLFHFHNWKEISKEEVTFTTPATAFTKAEIWHEGTRVTSICRNCGTQKTREYPTLIPFVIKEID